MTGRELYEAFTYVEDSYLDIADAPEKEQTEMKKRYSGRRMFTVLVAAVICVSILAVTAMAAGWIPNIFAAVKPDRKDDAQVLEAAIQATQKQEAETVTIPEIDFTQFILYERYYDGKSILLGYDLSKVIPETIVGYQPDNELLSQIKAIPQWQQGCHPDQKDDVLETNYKNGYITEELYLGALDSRTEYAKKYNLDKYYQILMDRELKETLSQEQYETFWNILLKEGSCCVAIPSDPWIGDRILINGTDFSEFIGPNLPGSFRSDYKTDVGDCIVLDPIPDAARNLDTVEVELSLKSSWRYWYMELNGDVYDYYVQNPVYKATFILENISK